VGEGEPAYYKRYSGGTTDAAFDDLLAEAGAIIWGCHRTFDGFPKRTCVSR
jgi:hypothetical protein